MEEQSYLIKRSAGFVSATLSGIPASYTFHTLAHTRQVVRATRIIGRASSLYAEQLKAVMIAAWFHDIGYVDGAELHEERSASVALKMLTTWGASSKILEQVERSIMATTITQNPKDILGMVLCDADLAHLGSPHYHMHVMLLRKEQEAMLREKFGDERLWDQRNIEFLKTHRYFTEYGMDILDRRKKTNLNKMIQQLHATPVIYY